VKAILKLGKTGNHWRITHSKTPIYFHTFCVFHN